MGFLKNIIRNAVSDGISKGIRDAVSSAAEKIVAPKAEAYANSVADSLDEVTQAIHSASAQTAHQSAEKPASSPEQAAERLSKSAEAYAKALENRNEGLRDWNEKLPGFPVWCFGGTDFWLDDLSDDMNSGTCFAFNADNAPYEGLEMYIALLKENGFVRKYPSADEVLYKDLGGEYLIFGCTDAFGTAPVMSVSLARTKDRSEIEC